MGLHQTLEVPEVPGAGEKYDRNQGFCGAKDLGIPGFSNDFCF